MCHMFLLNVEFSNAANACRFPFQRFQLPQCRHGRTEYCKLPAFLPNIQNVVTNFSCWQCLCTLLGPISLLYKQLLQYMLLKSFTIPSALWTKFPKKFRMKLLASDIIFTKLSTKTLLLWRCRVLFEYQGLLQNTPASFLLLFVNVHAGHTVTCVNTSWKRRRRDADIRSAAAVGGGGVSKMSAAAARRRRRTALQRKR